MRPPSDNGPAGDREIAALAGRQLGVVTRSQLADAGLSDGAIAHRVRARRLHRVHRGVYLLGHRAVAPRALWLAAALAVGDDAVLSHASAGAVWGIVREPDPDDYVHVTVSGRNPGWRTGIRIHRTRYLDRRDRRRLGALPLTSPARTLVDLASVLDRSGLEQVLAQGERRRLVRRPEVVAAVERCGPRHGISVLRALLDDGPAFTRSEAERRLLRLIRRAGLPTPEVNARLAGFEVDFLWREHGLVAEVDGYRYHADRAAFEADRRRDAELAARGYRVLRLTWRQLRSESRATVARLAVALRTRPVTGHGPP